MAQTFDHLHTGVWSFLDESQEERITRLYMPKWVSYEGASEALARMEHLLRHPPCGRMPSMLLYGDSDIGKTMIVDKFVRDHPNICNQFGEVEARKVLRLQMPSKPNDGRLYAQIIDGLGHRAPYTRRGTDLEILALRLLHQNPPRLMIVDEVHHLLAGSVRVLKEAVKKGGTPASTATRCACCRTIRSAAEIAHRVLGSVAQRGPAPRRLRRCETTACAGLCTCVVL
jgi:hypothetical protein